MPRAFKRENTVYHFRDCNLEYSNLSQYPCVFQRCNLKPKLTFFEKSGQCLLKIHSVIQVCLKQRSFPETFSF